MTKHALSFHNFEELNESSLFLWLLKALIILQFLPHLGLCLFYFMQLENNFCLCFKHLSYFHCHSFGTEKKVLLSKLRKASSSGKAIDVPKNTTNNKDVSTSTEDLGKDYSHLYFLPAD